MKKAVALFLGLALAASLTACSSGSSTPETTAAPETEAEIEEVAEAEYGLDTTSIIERGVLRVGVKDAVEGFGYQDLLTGEYSGMEIDIAKMIADVLGVDTEYTTVTAATRGELLDSGDIDCVLATFTITDERRNSWDFTTPYYTDHVTVLVQDDSGYYGLEDMLGAVVGVSSGSTSAQALVQACVDAGLIDSEDFDAETFDPATWDIYVSFKQYEDYPAISTALTAGEVDAFCVDKSILAVYNTADRHYIDDEFAPQQYGAATKLGSDFSDVCETLISGWLADGTIAGLIDEYGLD